MTALARPKDEIIALKVLARAALDQTENTPAAIGVLAHKLATDDAILAKVRDAVAFISAESVMHLVKHEKRQSSLIKPSSKADAGGKDDASGLAIIQLRNTTLYDFMVPGGSAIGGADKAAVEYGAMIYRRNAKGNYTNACWLLSVAKAMGDAEKVSDAFSLEQLAELRAKAEKRTTKI